MQKKRNTKQREDILNCLKQHASAHLTIQQIETLLKESSCCVSTATIYRNLNELLKLNMVRKFKLDGQTSACYQYIKNSDLCCQHFHMICSKCAKTVHFQSEGLVETFKKLGQSNDFEIDCPRTVFYGICEKCLHKS